MKINKTVLGDAGKLYLFWEQTIIATCKSYIVQIITPSNIIVSGALEGRPTSDDVILNLLDVTIENSMLAGEIYARHTKGDTLQFSFRGSINRPDGNFDEIFLTECVSSATDLSGIKTGGLPIWPFIAAPHEKDMEKIMLA